MMSAPITAKSPESSSNTSGQECPLEHADCPPITPRRRVNIKAKCAEFGTQHHRPFATVKLARAEFSTVNVPRNIVGPVVRQIRKEKGLTQAELCARLNLLGWDIGRDTLAKLETRVRWVADFEIIKLADALAVDPSVVLQRAINLAAKASGR